MNHLVSTLTLVALMSSGLAFAGAKKIPTWSLASDQDAARAVTTFGFRTEGKPSAYPKKIAIPWFQVRYDFTGVEGDGTARRVQFATADYQQLTDDLYAHLVQRLEADGFEIVGRDAVAAAAAYQALEGESAPDEGKGKARFAPSGMRLHPHRFGEPTLTTDLAAVNAELGTDAVVAVFANIATCEVEYTVRTGMAGTQPCLHGAIGIPGFSMQFVGADWKSRTYKELTPFVYAAREMSDGDLVTTDVSGESYDAALISPRSAVSWNKQDFWGDRTGDAQVGAFAQGARDMFDVALTLGLETWYDKADKAMAAASVTRPPRAPAPEGSRVVIGAELREERKATREEVEQMKVELEATRARFAAMPEGPPVAGKVSCYEMTGFMKTAGGDMPSNPTVLRRGFDEGQMVEEQISVTPVGPLVQKSVYEIADGAYVVTELKGAFHGQGTYEGEADAWSSWVAEIVMEGSTAEITGKRDGETLHTVTDVRLPDGTSPVSFHQTGALLDEAACTTRWAEIAASGGKKGKKK